MALKELTEKDKEEIREALKRWVKAARATAQRDDSFRGLWERSGLSRIKGLD